MSEDKPQMKNLKPYLCRAYWQWLSDSGDLPHFVIRASYPGVQVPPSAIVNGTVTLNLSLTAVPDLSMEDEWVSMSARFDGRPYRVSFPMESVEGIYGRFSQAGFRFEVKVPEEVNAVVTDAVEAPASDKPPSPPPKRSHLSIVK